MEQPIYLLLENGSWFQGKHFGAPACPAMGEVVFTTAMTGYLETLTDPSYYGQIVVQTFPLMGNYGVIPQDFESGRPRLTAYIVKEWCQDPSNFRSGGELDTFLKSRGVPGMYGLDTRALTKILRESGVMNGLLTTQAPPYGEGELAALRAYRVRDAVRAVSRTQPEEFSPQAAGPHIVLWDFGAKQNLIRELEARGCRVTAMPASSTAEEILAQRPDGLFLSNGPGDPAENAALVETLKRLLRPTLPMMGVCLGHQLLALAHGAKTEKLPYGHRGANQPVKNLRTGRVSITSQNHGYTVDPGSLPPGAEVSFSNSNDGTCEGIRYQDLPAFSVQFHPEACGGPRDTAYLFDDFLRLVRANRHCGEEREETVCL